MSSTSISTQNYLPFSFDEIKENLKSIAINEFGFSNSEYEGSNVQQIINIIAYEIANQNTSLYLNFKELFLDSAEIEENVIRHSIDLGYIPKRKESFKYKIKLLAKKFSELTIEKGQEFISQEGIKFFNEEGVYNKNFGYSLDTKSLYYKNGDTIFSKLNIGDTLFFDKNSTLKIQKFNSPDKTKMILSGDLTENFSKFKQEKQDIFTFNGGYNGDFRSLIKLGNVELYSEKDGQFLIQFNSNEDLFSFYTEENEERTLVSNGDVVSFDSDLNYGIKYIKSIKVKDENEYVSIKDLVFNEGDKNISLNKTVSVIEEKQAISQNDDFSGNISVNNTIYTDDPNIKINIEFDDFSYNVQPKDISIIDDTTVKVNPVIFSNEDKDLDIDSNNNIFISKANPTNVRIFLLHHSDGTSDEVTDFSFSDSNANKIHINQTVDSGDNISTIYYDYIQDIDGATADISYNHEGNYFQDKTVEIDYFYDSGSDSILDKPFFFTDLRGEIIDNEKDYDSSSNPLGWNGFRAVEFDRDNYILKFDLSSDTSLYAPYKDSSGNTIQQRINDVFNLFKLKRLYFPDSAGNFNSDNDFAELNDGSLIDTIEINVKQGEIINSTKKPELKFQLNPEMIDKGYFLLYNNNIETGSINVNIRYQNGLEIFEKKLFERKKSLIEKEDTSSESYSIVAIPDSMYPDYLRIYFDFNREKKYGDIVYVDIEYNQSLGSKGSTDTLIEIQSDNFESIKLDSSRNSLLISNGKDEESVQEIKTNAPKISNTLGRVVTKNDYLSVINESGICNDSNIWGGEEELLEKRKGNVFITGTNKLIDTSLVEKSGDFILKNSIESFLPKYYEITGRSDVQQPKDSSSNILFNQLDELKIIDIKLNYSKPSFILLDCDVTLSEPIEKLSTLKTKEKVALSLKDVSSEMFENFNGLFYKTGIIKLLTDTVGELIETTLDYKLKLVLKDNLSDYNLNLFDNYTQTDTIPNDDGIIGYNDTFIKSVFFKIEKTSIFSKDSSGNNIFDFEFLPDIETLNFLNTNDKIFIDKINNVKYYVNGVENSGINPNAFLFKLDIMYNPDLTDSSSNVKKVGNYYIDLENKIIKFEIFTKMNATDTDEALERNEFLNFYKYLNISINSNKLTLNKNSIGILNKVSTSFK